MPCLNPSGNAATPLINYEKTELKGGEVVLEERWGGVWLGAREEPGFLNSSKQTHYTGAGSLLH